MVFASQRLILGLLLVACLATPAAALDIYVNNETGDDYGNGRAPEFVEGRTHPVRTIKRALQLGDRYARIVIANTGKPYRECLSINGPAQSGNREVPFLIEGNGATLDGTRHVPPESWRHHAGDVFRYGPYKLTFPMLYDAQGRPLERVQADDAKDAPPELAPLQWCSWRRQTYFRIEPTKTIDDYELFEPFHDVGITLYKCEYVVISDLVIQGYRLDGVQAADGVFHTVLLGMTCRGNGRSGLAVAGASRMDARALLLGDNGQGPESKNSAQFIAEGYSQTILDGVQIIANAAPAQLKLGHAKVEERAPAEEVADPAPKQE